MTKTAGSTILSGLPFVFGGMEVSVRFVPLFFLLIGCYDDIPAAHKGRMFDKASLWCPIGGEGLTGDVQPAGSYFTGWCDELRTVNCSTVIDKETMASLTKDGVQFNLDVYVRYSANCANDGSVKSILDNVSPAQGDVVGAEQLFQTFVRPALGEAVRETVSPYVANDINAEREAILLKVRESFLARVNAQQPQLVVVQEVNLSNLDFPDAMDVANTDRATQAILKDKAIAERERVTAEIETAKMKEELARTEGRVEAAKIQEIGAALARNPGYLQFMLQTQMPGIYEKAGAQGNLVIAAPNVTIAGRNTLAAAAATER